MTFEEAMNLAQALKQREMAAKGLERVLYAASNVMEVPDAMRQTVQVTATAWLDAQRTIEKLVDGA